MWVHIYVKEKPVKYSFFHKIKWIIPFLKCTYIKNKTNKKKSCKVFFLFSDTVCSDVTSAVKVGCNSEPGFQLKQLNKESSLFSIFHKFLHLQLL